MESCVKVAFRSTIIAQLLILLLEGMGEREEHHPPRKQEAGQKDHHRQHKSRGHECQRTYYIGEQRPGCETPCQHKLD